MAKDALTQNIWKIPIRTNLTADFTMIHSNYPLFPRGWWKTNRQDSYSSAARWGCWMPEGLRACRCRVSGPQRRTCFAEGWQVCNSAMTEQAMEIHFMDVILVELIEADKIWFDSFVGITDAISSIMNWSDNFDCLFDCSTGFTTA